jgi:hypothetical protein
VQKVIQKPLSPPIRIASLHDLFPYEPLFAKPGAQRHIGW